MGASIARLIVINSSVDSNLCRAAECGPRIAGISQSFEIPVQLYRSAWKILTVIWAVVSLIKAIILVLSQLKLPLEVFLIVRTASGFPVLALMLIFTYRFPRWYWARARVNSQ